MKKSIIILWVLAVVLGFISGYRYARKDIVVYRVNELDIALHTDWPTYGLPLAEYTAVRTLLREGKIDRASELLDTLIEIVQKDACIRASYLEDQNKELVEKLLE